VLFICFKYLSFLIFVLVSHRIFDIFHDHCSIQTSTFALVLDIKDSSSLVLDALKFHAACTSKAPRPS